MGWTFVLRPAPVLLSAAVLFSAEIARSEEALEPGRFRSEEGGFSFRLDESWRKIPSAALEGIYGEGGAAVEGGDPGWRYQVGFQHASSRHPFEHPFFLVRSQRQVVLETTPAAWQRGIEDEMQRSTEGMNAGDLPGAVSFSPPRYDSGRRLLTYTDRVFVERDGAQAPVARLHAIFFGRERIVIFYFASEADAFERLLPEFRSVLDSFAFEPDPEAASLERRLVIAALGILALAVSGALLHRRFGGAPGGAEPPA